MIRKKFSRKEITLFVCCLGIIVVFFSFYIWHQTESIQIGYSIGELEEEITGLNKEVEKLETIRSQLLSLERVERIAKEKLKMAAPRQDQVYYEELKIDAR
jgi:cell division protein FtsL